MRYISLQMAFFFHDCILHAKNGIDISRVAALRTATNPKHNLAGLSPFDLVEPLFRLDLGRSHCRLDRQYP